MAEATDVKHDYHLVDPSPWPLIGSISAFTMMIGLVMTMKGLGPGHVQDRSLRPRGGRARRPLHHDELVERRDLGGRVRATTTPASSSSITATA